MPKELSQTVVNAMRLLDCFSNSEELGITELAAAVGLGKTVTARLVSSLAEYGYLWQNPSTKRYRLGLKFLYWGSLVEDRDEAARLAEPYLRKLAEKFHLTAHLAVPEKHAALIVRKISAGPMVYMTSRVGTTLPLHGSAMGKCMFALASPEVQEDHLSHMEMTRYTENTIVDKALFLEECQRVRARGYAMDIEEASLGLCCIAVPIWDSMGRVIAAISASGQVQYVLDNQAAILQELRQIQETLVRNL